MNTYTNTNFARAYPAPLTGKFRVKPEDFSVDEQMDIDLSGSGEHLWLKVRKTGANTDWVAKQLAQAAGIPAKDAGYAGLKDRHAVTTQWFSLQLPGKADPDFNGLPDEIEVLDSQRHDKKLKRGALSGNRFTLTLRNVSGDLQQAAEVCQQISAQGIPNYFGAQRFGHNHGNLNKAENWFSGAFKPKQRNQRSLYLSAARSWLFNHVLSARVERGDWNQYVAGDVFMFEGGNGWFADDGSADLVQRLAEMAIHPTGMLWGRGELATDGLCAELEREQAALFPVFCQGLEKQGLKQERRALRINTGSVGFEVLAQDSPKNATLRLVFELPPGAYATVLLEQLGHFQH